jgi:hypothetical protein
MGTQGRRHRSFFGEENGEIEIEQLPVARGVMW